MSRRLHTLASVIMCSTLSLAPACQSTGSGAIATPTLLPDPEPTFALPATQVFPTPELTPTSKPTPQLPDTIAIDEQANIPYTSNQKLDVYSPLLHNDWPIVVILHGGRLSKESVRRFAIAVAGQGAVAFVPEYQSYEPPPDQIVTGAQETACAIRFARAYGSDYRGDPNRIIVVGHSAGGAFGALIALAGDQFHGDCLVTEGSAIPDEFIGLDGAYDILRYIPEARLRMAPPEEWLGISPYAYIDTGPGQSDPSFHLFVGRETELLQDAQAFRDALQQAGYEVTLTQFPGVDHMRIASGAHANTIWAIATIMDQ